MEIRIIRQPDINSYLSLSDEFGNYGRFGITNSGAFYVLPVNTAHLNNTLIGGFWAANRVKDILYLYPRGDISEFEFFVQDIIESKQIEDIAEAAGLRH